MRVINRFTASLAASLLLAAVAHAADAPGGAYATAPKSKAISGTDLPWNGYTFQRVLPVAQHSAEPDRTSKIGTGTAATSKKVVESFQPVVPAKPHYPGRLWSATFGTGGAAALEH